MAGVPFVLKRQEEPFYKKTAAAFKQPQLVSKVAGVCRSPVHPKDHGLVKQVVALGFHGPPNTKPHVVRGQADLHLQEFGAEPERRRALSRRLWA